MTLRRARPPAVDRLLNWVERLRDSVAVVWGDFVLDEYWRCLSRRVSREAPVLILEYQGRSTQGGGAANAALNLAALGLKTRAVGFVGHDAAGQELTQLLSDAGVDCAGLIPLRRASTVVKTRVVAGSVHTALQQVVRVDRGRPFGMDAASRRRLDAALETAERGARIALLSDYGYDSVTPALAAPRVRRWRTRRVTVALDARYRITEYRGVTLATPNESEASAAAGLSVTDDRDLAAVASRLQQRMKAAHLVITRGRDGLTLWGRGGGQSLAAWGGQEAVDVTGAGDAVVAVSAAALAAGASPLESAALANVAGAVAVSRRGAVAVSRDDLERALRAGTTRRLGAEPRMSRARTAEKVVTHDRTVEIVRAYKSEGSRVVLANGVFDLLHVGHVRYLTGARGLGERLVVAVNGDRSAHALKGPGRPVQDARERATLVAALAVVDHVVIFEEGSVDTLLESLAPDVHAKGTDYRVDTVPERATMARLGGVTAIAGDVKQHASGELYQRIRRGDAG